MARRVAQSRLSPVSRREGDTAMLHSNLKPQMPRSLLVACFGATVALSGTGASSALAETLNLSGPSAATVGQPLVVQASGIDNPANGTLYLELDAIPGGVVSSCPASYLDGSQLATSTGGSLVAFDDREIEDGAGNFSMPVGYTPQKPGNLLLCGYTDDGATDTLAASSLIVPVSAPTAGGGNTPPSSAPSPAVKPANTAKPHVTRSGHNLVCGAGTW